MSGKQSDGFPSGWERNNHAACSGTQVLLDGHAAMVKNLARRAFLGSFAPLSLLSHLVSGGMDDTCQDMDALMLLATVASWAYAVWPLLGWLPGCA